MHENYFKPLKVPIDTFFFDCDSTLSLIEGIDVLAAMNGVYEKVQQITERCMSQTGLNLNAYRKRLALVQPDNIQLETLAKEYIIHITPGAHESINVLQHLNKKIYIISAGIKSSILPLAHHLGISEDNVFAVDVYFNPNGTYKGFNEKSHLVKRLGKPMLIKAKLAPNERSLLIGDGMSDWEARDAVTRFVGFAGLNSKQWIHDHSNFYIKNNSLLSLIPLSLTDEEIKQLSPEDYSYYQLGLKEIYNGTVLIKEYGNDSCADF